MAKKAQTKAKAAKPAKEEKSRTAGKRSSSKKSVGARAAKAMPDAPSIEIPQGVRDVGAYLSSALNTDAGRVIMAELLIQVAKALTTRLAATETAHNAVAAVRSAGEAAGDAVRDAGEAAVEAGSDLASAAKGVAKEVAQAAVGAVGGAVVRAAQDMVPGGRKGKGSASSPAPSATATTIPVSRARPRGTPRPPQLGGSGPRR